MTRHAREALEKARRYVSVHGNQVSDVGRYTYTIDVLGRMVYERHYGNNDDGYLECRAIADSYRRGLAILLLRERIAALEWFAGAAEGRGYTTLTSGGIVLKESTIRMLREAVGELEAMK